MRYCRPNLHRFDNVKTNAQCSDGSGANNDTLPAQSCTTGVTVFVTFVCSDGSGNPNVAESCAIGLLVSPPASSCSTGTSPQ